MLNPALAGSLGSRSRFRRPVSSSRALMHNVNGKLYAQNVDHGVNDCRSMAEAKRKLRGSRA